MTRSETFWCLRRPAGGETRSTLDKRSGPETERTDPERKLLCITCGTCIARDADRIDVQGAHAHQCTNPDGVTYRIGCFARASRTTAIGTDTLRYTWFSGYTWQVILCTRCGTHLGWAFSRSSSRFYGLILDRLNYPQ